MTTGAVSSWPYFSTQHASVWGAKDPNKHTSRNDAPGTSALIQAAAQGDQESVARLLLLKVDLEAKDGQGWTALHHAVAHAHEGAIQLLLAAKARVNTLSARQMTPLMEASQKGLESVVRILLNAKAFIESSNDTGERAVMLATRAGRTGVLKILHQAGANINARNHFEGSTALTIALSERPSMIGPVINLDADLDYARRVTKTRSLAAIWGIQGKAVANTKNESFSFKLKDLTPFCGVELLLKHAKIYFDSRMGSILTLVQRSEIENCLDYTLCQLADSSMSTYLSEPNDFNIYEDLRRLYTKKTVILFGGFKEYPISMLLCKDSAGRYHLTLCNRNPSHQGDTTKVYLIDERHIHTETLIGLRKVYETQKEFVTFFHTLGLRGIDGFKQSLAREGGAVVWKNIKAIFRVLCERCMDQMVAKNFCKVFFRYSMRQKELEEHLNTVPYPDTHLLLYLREVAYRKTYTALSPDLLKKLNAELNGATSPPLTTRKASKLSESAKPKFGLFTPNFNAELAEKR